MPRLLLWSAAALENARTSAAAEPARTRLRQEAEAALETGPFSVMDKPLTPPSGDKHDYMSFAPYWWPNPDTRDGLPYIRRDGEVNPERDLLDNTAFGRMCAAVETLALAGFVTGNALYAERAAHLLRVWFLVPATRMNPHLEYGQAIRGVTDGRGIGIIDTATRFGALLDSLALLEDAGAWTEADKAALRTWLTTYLRWLLESEKGRDEARQHNNHGTWYDVHAASLARFVGDQAAAEVILRAVPQRRIATQIAPDGRQPHELARTRAFSYSVMNLRAFFDLATLGEPVGVGLGNYQTQDGRGIRAALDWLIPYATGAKPWEYPQISPFTPAPLLPLLHRAARAWPDGGYARVLETIPGGDAADRSRLLYGATATG